MCGAADGCTDDVPLAPVAALLPAESRCWRRSEAMKDAVQEYDVRTFLFNI